MNCPLRKKRKYKFLLWEIKVPMPHEWDILDVGVHMPYVSDKFKISRQCKHCGKWEMKHFIEHEELISLGFSQEYIEKALRKSI